MYKKKEFIYLIILIFIFIVIGLYLNNENEKTEYLEENNMIIVTIDGELARKTVLEVYHQTTYGSVFLKIKH